MKFSRHHTEQVWSGVFIVFGHYQGLDLINFCSTLFYMGKLKHTIHIGSLIGAKIESKGMSYAEFARRLGCDRTTVYNIIRSNSIDMARLMRISKILDYDFIKKVYLSEANDENTVSLKVELSPDDVDLLKTHEISEIVIKVKVKPSADNER